MNKLYICNPITGEYVEIPGPEVEQGQVASTQPVGFYYSPQSHQCKILINRPWGTDVSLVRSSRLKAILGERLISRDAVIVINGYKPFS
ncbi:hypothetical protein NC652_002385 [Populus alba x Populus x berolinensis]|nr:hypothetical protein NC652_002385 [Populus alba x Populus x berolinensis]